MEIREKLEGKDWYQQQEIGLSNLREAISWYMFIVTKEEPSLERVDRAVDEIFKIAVEDKRKIRVEDTPYTFIINGGKEVRIVTERNGEVLTDLGNGLEIKEVRGASANDME